MNEITGNRMYVYTIGLLNIVNGKKQSKRAAFSAFNKDIKRELEIENR